MESYWLFQSRYLVDTHRIIPREVWIFYDNLSVHVSDCVIHAMLIFQHVFKNCYVSFVVSATFSVLIYCSLTLDYTVPYH